MKKLFTIGAMLVMVAFAAQAQVSNIVYVDKDATGNGNGTSWANAYVNLDDALSANFVPGMSIWIAEGVYTVDDTSGSRSFVIDNAESLYGGFAGTETALGQRDIEAHPTILSGDIAGDDVGAPDTNPNHADNAEAVIELAPATAVAAYDYAVTLDGLTITRGYADSSGGAGILTTNMGTWSNPMYQNGVLIHNCKIVENYAMDRSAFLIYQDFDGDIELFNTIIADNVSEFGWAIEYRAHSSIVEGTVANCLFKGNRTLDPNSEASLGRFTNLSNAADMSIQFINNTITENAEGDSIAFGALFYMERNGGYMEVSFYNNVIFGNTNSHRVVTVNATSADLDNYIRDNYIDYLWDSTDNRYIDVSPFTNDTSNLYALLPAYAGQANTLNYKTSYLPLVDLAGDDRVTMVDTTISHGAYEVPLPYVNYVIDTTTNPVDTNTTAITELDVTTFQMYPNPATNSVNIVHQFTEQVEVGIYNVTGQRMISTVLAADERTLDIATLPTGMYIVELRAGDVKTTRKLIVR